jgi:hypothetical protein
MESGRISKSLDVETITNSILVSYLPDLFSLNFATHAASSNLFESKANFVPLIWHQSLENLTNTLKIVRGL